MKQVFILESDDLIRLDDWCRPLSIESMSGGQSDYYSFKSCYTSCPENNAEWTRVSAVIGECWLGKTVAQYNRVGCKYEFVRGDIPQSHKLNMRGYSDLSKTISKIKNRQYDDDYDDIPF